MHLESMPFWDYQKTETLTSVVFNFKENSVDYMKIMKLIKKMIKQMYERVKYFQMSGALRRCCTGSSKAIYTISG